MDREKRIEEMVDNVLCWDFDELVRIAREKLEQELQQMTDQEVDRAYADAMLLDYNELNQV